jgi:Domain of unknown function (DUF4956)
MIDSLVGSDFGSVPTHWPLLLLSLLLAFLCGQAMAWIYMFTHTGLSYSRSFVNSLVLMPVLVSLVMQVLNNNLVTAFGLMAVFAIVRFRNILRDTLDTTFVLSVIVLGMASGTHKFGTAVIGCLLVSGILTFLHLTSFGSRHRYDLILNLHWARSLQELTAIGPVLARHSLKSYCASQRSHEASEGVDLSYRVLLRDASRGGELIEDLRSLDGVSRVTSLKAEEESEL